MAFFGLFWRHLARSICALVDYAWCCRKAEAEIPLKHTRSSHCGQGFGLMQPDPGSARTIGQGDLGDVVYRIGREAIINACRHSRARDIETQVDYAPTELRVAVRDKGCGIDAHQLQWGRNGHWGLKGMPERAEQIGARLRLWSDVALGTEVELRVPGRVAFQ